jgi:hypothetical protein
MQSTRAKCRAVKIEMVDREVARILATKTEAERLQIAWGLWRSARDMLLNLIASQQPELSAEEVDRIVAERMSHAG